MHLVLDQSTQDEVIRERDLARHDVRQPEFRGSELDEHAAFRIFGQSDVLRGVLGRDAGSAHVDLVASVSEVVDLEGAAAGVDQVIGAVAGRDPLDAAQSLKGVVARATLHDVIAGTAAQGVIAILAE